MRAKVHDVVEASSSSVISKIVPAEKLRYCVQPSCISMSTSAKSCSRPRSTAHGRLLTDKNVTPISALDPLRTVVAPDSGQSPTDDSEHQVMDSGNVDTASVPSRTVTELPHLHALGMRKPAAVRPTSPSKSAT